MKQPDPYYFETIKMTSQAQSKFTENTRLWLVFSIQNLTRLVTSCLWFQDSIDQLFHRISVKYIVYQQAGIFEITFSYKRQV